MTKNEVGHGMMNWDACSTCKNYPGDEVGGCKIGYAELSIDEYECIHCEDYEEAMQ